MSSKKSIYLGPYLEVLAPGRDRHIVYEITAGYFHAEEVEEGIFAAMPNRLKPEPPRKFMLTEAGVGATAFGLIGTLTSECIWLEENYKEAINKIRIHPDVESVDVRWGCVVWFS